MKHMSIYKKVTKKSVEEHGIWRTQNVDHGVISKIFGHIEM